MPCNKKIASGFGAAGIKADLTVCTVSPPPPCPSAPAGSPPHAPPTSAPTHPRGPRATPARACKAHGGTMGGLPLTALAHPLFPHSHPTLTHSHPPAHHCPLPMPNPCCTPLPVPCLQVAWWARMTTTTPRPARRPSRRPTPTPISSRGGVSSRRGPALQARPCRLEGTRCGEGGAQAGADAEVVVVAGGTCGSASCFIRGSVVDPEARSCGTVGACSCCTPSGIVASYLRGHGAAGTSHGEALMQDRGLTFRAGVHDCGRSGLRTVR